MRVDKILQSKNNWKKKAMSRGKSIREQRRKIKELEKKELDAAKNILDLKREISDLKKRSSFTTPQSIDEFNRVRVVCVMNIIVAAVSFRSIPKLFRYYSELFNQKSPWVPHFTSVINWTTRFGLGLLNSIKAIQEPWVAVVDTSIDVGVKKVFVALRVKLSTIQDKGSAVTLKDCECIGIKCDEAFNGEKIKQFLCEIFSASGNPVAVVKDGGRDIKRGLDLYVKETRSKIFEIDDISHVIANALKSDFSKNDVFKKLLKIVNSGAKKLRQTDIYFLKPPLIRAKGRFMSISRVINWCDKIISVISHSGRAKKGSLLSRLRKVFPGLSKYKYFIVGFREMCQKSNEIMSILKNEGLNRSTYQRVLAVTETLPPRSKIKFCMERGLKKHIRSHCMMSIGQTPLLVSSECELQVKKEA